MISIDYQSRTPLYEQIVERFQRLILKGILEPGSQMPSVRTLAIKLSINPNTIQKAYTLLEQQGYIYPVKGRGNFIADASLLLKQQQEHYLKELEQSLLRAKDFGITKDDCYTLIHKIYHEEVLYD